MTASVQLGKYSEKAPTAFRLPDEGVYFIKLDDWDEPRQSAYIDKETGEYPLRINLKFKITKDLEGDTEFEGCDVGKWCGLDLNPNDKGSIWNVLLALDPANEPEPGMEIEDYRGKACKGVIEHSKPKVGADGQQKVFANITKVMASKKQKPAAAPAPKANPLLDEDEE